MAADTELRNRRLAECPVPEPVRAARRLRELAAECPDPHAAAIADEVVDWLEAVLDRVLFVEAQVLHVREDVRVLTAEVPL